MRKTEFDCLHEDQKINLLRRDGVYISKLTLEGITSMLYQLHGFYVEIYYRSYREKILKIETTLSPAILDKYPPEKGKESVTTNLN